MSEAGKMWGGRFAGELDPFFARFQRSLPVDHVLALHDLDVNAAWSQALGRAGVLTRTDVERLQAAFADLRAEWQRDGVPVDDGAEDVHSLVERALAGKVGDLAKRVHTGRSRNDQVATDLRLELKGLGRELLDGLTALAGALVQQADTHASDALPGYTHLQRAQPITIGHWALAHAEGLARDRGRVLDALARLDRCPLGSGALAGTTVPVDRDALAQALGFAGGATRNSLDATSARDHACELLFAAAMTMANLSRLGEDCVFFASAEAAFASFGDRVSTGSSLMPQKRNPDAMELVRGNAGAVFGALLALLTTLKGLPLAYNRDLQEDKGVLLPALRRTIDCLRVAAIAVQDLTFATERCAREAARGYLNATDLADLLVAAGVSFRDAHEQVGRAVDRAIALGCELQDLPAAELQQLLPRLGGDCRGQLAVDAVLARRDVVGGTAPRRVRAEVERWQRELETWQSATGRQS